MPENQQALKFIPCTGHSRIYLLQMDDVAFVSSRMSGVYVTSSEGKEGFTELTLRTLESRTPLLRCHRQFLVNMAHLQEIRLEDNGQAELDFTQRPDGAGKPSLSEKFKRGDWPVKTVRISFCHRNDRRPHAE